MNPVQSSAAGPRVAAKQQAPHPPANPAPPAPLSNPAPPANPTPLPNPDPPADLTVPRATANEAADPAPLSNPDPLSNPAHEPHVLVVGVGNVLHGDDGFGVEVAKRLAEQDLPPQVTVAETGIGGIHLVHELMSGYDAVVVVDAVDRGRAPGTVMVIDAEVIDVADFRVEDRHDLLADMHLATPERALMVARALGVLPSRTVIIGCQPLELETLGVGLTAPVSRAVDVAIVEIGRCLDEMAANAPSATQ